jgi:hypothetical protein
VYLRLASLSIKRPALRASIVWKRRKVIESTTSRQSSPANREASCEFMAADLDGNLIRVFYDFRGDM